MKFYQTRGSALVYILIAIALIAALTAVFMQPASQQTRTQNSFKLAAELNSQVQMIRSAIQDCILIYQQGDGEIPANVSNYVGPNYPLEPDSTYLDSPAANKSISGIRCPGNNPGTGHENEHELIFSGSTGRFMPSTPALFNPWTYRNGNNLSVFGQTLNGVYFEISTAATDAYLAEAMQKVDEQFTPCEVDYIAGDGTNGCDTDNKCLRVWVKRVAPSCP